MTSPEASAAVLAAVSGWDVPLLRGAVATLDGVTGRLTTWRTRFDAVTRELAAADCWSGPAAQEAAAVLFQLSSAGAAVAGGLGRSLDAFERVAVEGAHAQRLATEALTSAAAEPGGLAGVLAAERETAELQAVVSALLPGPDAPPSTVTGAALRHARGTSVAATDAGAALRGLGVVDAFGPTDFAELVLLAGAPVPELLPAACPPAQVAAWWAALPAGAHAALIGAHPGRIGALDGVPAWARDRANRLLLDSARRDPGPAGEAARAVADRIAGLERDGRPVQLHLFDASGDRVALALGDLDDAAAVGVLVPGIWTTPEDDLGELVDHAADVADAARAASPGLAVATVAWIGYRTPSTPLQIGTRTLARRGGRTLDRTLDGLAAVRGAAGLPAARTTVLAHSYGTLVVDEAADEPGRLAADAVVLLGSPGMEFGSASGLEARQVFDAAAPDDLVAQSWALGVSPDWPFYGSESLPAEWGTGHTGYYDADRPTLAPMGEVVAGTGRGR